MSKRTRIIAAIGAAICVASSLSLSACGVSDEEKYSQAMRLYEDGYYAEAAVVFEALGDYEESDYYFRKSRRVWSGYKYYEFNSLNLGYFYDKDYDSFFKYGYSVISFAYDAWENDGNKHRIVYGHYDETGKSKQSNQFRIVIEDDYAIKVRQADTAVLSTAMSEAARGKEDAHFIPYKDYLIEKSALFHGSIPENRANAPMFDAEFTLDDERYVFREDGTYTYSGDDADTSGAYCRKGDIISLYNTSKDLLVYKNTIVDRGYVRK